MRRIAGARADVRIRQQKIDDGLKPRLNLAGTTRRMCRDGIEDLAEVNEGRTGVAQPHKPCLTRAAQP